MLDIKDEQTLFSLRLLNDLVRQSSKPLLLWVGAGASAWAGYPLWGELAESFHRQFLKYESDYDKTRGLQLLDAKEYPRFFQLCCDTHDTRYYKTLADLFSPKTTEPVYKRFIGAVAALQPLHIVTTNIDEMLEHSVPAAAVVQRTDLERCADLLHERHPFICKLHGTVSAVETAVLTTRDYVELVQDSKYLPLLRHLFIECTVVFVGYSLSDQYVLSLLADTVALRSLFGDGPHFVISTSTSLSLPESVHGIRYVPEPHKDHRTAIQVLELLDPANRPANSKTDPSPATERLSSAHFVSDLYPPGAWMTSQELPLMRQNGEPALAITGLGWSDFEFPNSVSTAMHDLIVGLLCFDRTYVPLERLGEALRLLGQPVLNSLLASDAIRFIGSDISDASEAVFYPDTSTPVGHLTDIKTKQSRDSAVDAAETTNSEADAINRQIHEVADFSLKHGAWTIVPGQEEGFEKFLRSLEPRVETPGERISRSVIDLTNSLMMFPRIRAAIGISGGTPLNAIPRWTALPVLRLANVVRVSLTCERLRLASMKLLCGSAELAARAFSAAAGRVWADDIASYVLAGRYNTDIGEYVMQDPAILWGILAFRETQAGVSLRKELFAQLLINKGGDILAAIDASLRSGLPPTVLERARNQLSGLFLNRRAGQHSSPMVWRDMNAGHDPLKRWRARSFKAFKEHCLKLGIREYDRCPCGSGEKVRFCCEEALQV